MADEVKIGLEVTAGASQANLEKGITAPLKEVDAAGKAAATSLTEGVRQIEEATTGAAEAEQKLVAATEQVAEAGKGAGEGIAAGFERVAEAAAGAVAAEEEVAQGAEGIATASEQASATTAEALGAVTDAAGATTTAVAGIGGAATAAGDQATTAFDEAAAAAEEAAAAAQQIGPNISEGFAEVADQAQLVQDAVDKFYQRLADGLAPGRGALRQISAQYSILGDQIAEAEGLTAEEAAAAQANYKQIGAAIQGVIAKQREFNAELKSAQIATKEGGEQLALMGIAAEQLGKHFGEIGAEVGSVAGEVGILSMVLTQLARAFKGMDLNTLQTSFAGVKANMAGAAIQAGLVAAVFAVASAAGIKLADTNEQNAESVKDLVKAFKDFVTGGGEFGAWLGRIQAELQVFVADTINAAGAIVDLDLALASGDPAKAAVAIAQLRQAYSGLGKEMDLAAAAQDKEHLSAKIAAEAHEALKKSTHDLGGEVHSGADEIGKLDSKTSQLSKTTQFYIETQKLGAAGQRLWNQALDAANGSEQKLAEIIQKLHPEMEKLIENYRKAKAEIDLQLDAIKKQIDEEKKLIETEEAESRAIQKKVTDLGTEEAARQKLHETIKGEIDDLSKLDTAHDGTSGSIEEVAKHIAELTSEFDDEQPAIDQLVARLESLAKSTVGLSDDTKRYIEEIETEKKSIDELTQKNKDLQKEEDQLVQKGDQLTKSDYERIQAIDKETTSNQIAIQQAKDKITADAQLLQGQKAQTAATIEITGANGRAVDSQHKLTTSTQDETKAAKEAGTGLSELAKNVHINAEKAAELSDESKGIEISVGKAGDASEKAGGKFKETGDGLDKVAASAKITNENLDKVGTSVAAAADKSKQAADLLKKVAQEDEDAWKKSGIAVDEHKKKVEDLIVTYKNMKDQSKATIDSMIADLQKLDAQTKKTAGDGSTAAPAPSSGGPTPAPSGPKQPASDSGGGSSGHS